MVENANCIYQLVKYWADRNPKNIAIMAPGCLPLNYHLLYTNISKVGKMLNSMGISVKDRVATVIPNGPEAAVAFITIASNTAIAPLNPAYQAEEFDFYFSDLKIKALIIHSEINSPAIDIARIRGIPIIKLQPLPGAEAGIFTLEGEKTEEIIQNKYAQPSDVALLLHTSGTTSKPKLVPLTHANLCCSSCHIQQTLQLVSSDRCLNIMPLFHIHGLIAGILSSLASGASVVCPPGFYAPNFFEWMETFCPTWYTAVPTMHQAILAHSTTNQEIIAHCPLRFIRSSSSALPLKTMAELEDVFKAPVIEAYGMTEASHQIASNPLPPHTRKGGSVGRAAGPEVAIMDEEGNLLSPGEIGEIVIRGPNVVCGYEGNSSSNQKSFTNGWFRTGDQGYIDTDGYIFIRGRLKEIINRGGEKISPREVDEVLLSHPAIAQAVTFAVPHEKLGEEIAAAVVLHNDASVTEREIRAFSATHIAAFKVPRYITIVNELPKGPTGKLQRIGLAQSLGISSFQEIQNASETLFVAPRTPIETLLAVIWSQILGMKHIGIHDNFFVLGGDSILATRIISSVRQLIHIDLSPIALFEEPTIARLALTITQGQTKGAKKIEMIELLAKLDALSEEEARRIILQKLAEQIASQEKQASLPPVQTSANNEDCPLSFLQRTFWTFHQLAPESPQYNVLAAYRLTGHLNLDALESSLNELIKRHETLRTTFPIQQAEPVQHIGPEFALAVQVVTVAHLPESEREREALHILQAEAKRPFNLIHGPLLRAHLVQLSEEIFLLLLNMHHIISDGWSLEIFVRELSLIYQAKVTGQPYVLTAPLLQYKDFVRWQYQQLQTPLWEQQLSYWHRQLANAPQLLELPTDHPRPSAQTFRGAQKWFSLPRTLLASIEHLKREEGVTFFMTLLATWAVLLSRYSDQEDLIIGTATANRASKEAEQVIGAFVNTLALRINIGRTSSFRDILRQVRRVCLEAYAHQDVPFEKLLETLSLQRTLSHTPLFQVLFVLEEDYAASLQLPNVMVSPIHLDTGAAIFDLVLEIVNTQQELVASWQYNTDLFDESTIERMASHFQRLLTRFLQQPDHPIERISWLTEQEQRQLLNEWNATATTYPQETFIHELIQHQAEQTPNAYAVVSAEKQLTYGELTRKANQLARYLRKLGVGPDIPVGIALTPSIEMAIGLLGILQAGGAYVPLDPSHPRSRLAHILDDAQVSVVLTQQRWAKFLSIGERQILLLDSAEEDFRNESEEKPSNEVEPGHLAYIVYTSGSTGQPKGVGVTHANVTHFVWWHRQTYAVTANDRASQVIGFGFDALAHEIWPTLIAGASLYIPDEAIRQSPPLLRDWLVANKITLSCVPAPLAEELLLLTWPAHTPLRFLLAGGDKLHRYPQPGLPFTLVNHYGPTECTVAATTMLVSCIAEPRRTPPIGRPLPNVQVYILDRHLQPVPIGIAGELYIGGAGVSRGYLYHPDLTAERFLPNPFNSELGTRLYRTGDLVRYLPDGNLEFLGRIDQQVKLRGFRIELGEIEANLAQHPAVRKAVVLVHDDQLSGGRQLVAYVVLAPNQAVSTAHLRDYLHQALPEYMVPTQFVELQSLPITPNGKIDRAALPAPDFTHTETEATYVSPRTPLEVELAKLYANVLGVAQIGIYNSFLDYGGNSLIAIRLVAKLHEALQIDIPIRTLFDAPTIAELAAVIEENRAQWKAQLNVASGNIDANTAQDILAEFSNLSDKEVEELLYSLQVKEDIDADI